jgi:hypothetical protein
LYLKLPQLHLNEPHLMNLQYLEYLMNLKHLMLLHYHLNLMSP